MECEQKIQLVEEHHRAALDYSRKMGKLKAKLRTANTAEYKNMQTLVDEARARSIEANESLKRRRAEHGC